MNTGSIKAVCIQNFGLGDGNDNSVCARKLNIYNFNIKYKNNEKVFQSLLECGRSGVLKKDGTHTLSEQVFNEHFREIE